MKRKALIFFLLTGLSLAAIRTGSHASSAGAQIEGKVSDPAGAVVIDALITVSDPSSNLTFITRTDEKGHYRLQDVPAGIYTIEVSAKGFATTRQEATLEEGLVKIVDFKLQIAPLETVVSVESEIKPNSDPVYQQLRRLGESKQDFAGPFAQVNDLVLKRDAAIFKLKRGEIYFGEAVAGRTVAAVFFGEGELTLAPPTAIERHSLSNFIGEEQLVEPFSHLLIKFTDKTFEEIKASPGVTMGVKGPRADEARNRYRDNQDLLRKRLRDRNEFVNRNVVESLRYTGEVRALTDLYAPERPGFFSAFIDGDKHHKLVFILDPLGIPSVSPEEVSLSSYGYDDSGTWTAFHLAEEYAANTTSSAEEHRLFDITHHQLDVKISATRLTGSDRLTLKPLVAGRVLPFELFATLRVSRVLDNNGQELPFIQESDDEVVALEGRGTNFAVILPESPNLKKSITLTVEYSGNDALSDSGSGNYFLRARGTWYPANAGSQFGDRAIFDITFRYRKDNVLVATGNRVAPERMEGDTVVAAWTSGNIELPVAGFNYGDFKKVDVADSLTGYQIEFYANRDLPEGLRREFFGSVSTTGAAKVALADAQNATRIFDGYFGKLPYQRLAITQQPAAFFGQAWPTLIYMPYTAFLDPTQLHFMFGDSSNTFYRYVMAHEISHQWWGHTIGWQSHHDQWMSEGFAEFSTSLYVQYVRRDLVKFHDFWNLQRDSIVQTRPGTKDKRPYTVGPVTLGSRLDSGKSGSTSRFLIYPKGAYILHMLRMMMYDRKDQDKRFSAMMKDFVSTYFNRDVTTEDFKRVVEKHMTHEMDIDRNQKLDWFFDEWVYGLEIPSYRFEYYINEDGTVGGRITQSGVSDKFVMRVPIYIDYGYGKGWLLLGSVTLAGNSSVELPNVKLATAPKQASICALDDVLAIKIENRQVKQTDLAR